MKQFVFSIINDRFGFKLWIDWAVCGEWFRGKARLFFRRAQSGFVVAERAKKSCAVGVYYYFEEK